MTSKQRRLVRKWKKENPKEAANLSREEIFKIISKEKGSEKKKNLYKGDKQSYNIDQTKVFAVNDPEIPEGSRCWVCGKEVIESTSKTGVIAHIGGNRFYHKKGCGPNTRKWVLGHPALVSLLVYIDANANQRGGGLEKLKEFKANFYPDQIMAWTADQIIKYLDWEEAGFPLPVYHMGRKSWVGPKIYDNQTDFEEVDGVEKFIEKKEHKKLKEEVIMSKKDKEEKKEKKNMGGLVPKEPTVVPKELYKHPQIGKLLKVLRDSDDDTDKRKARKALRDLGFKLSEESTWKPFLAGKLAKVEDEDEEDEEEAPKKGKKDKKEDKKASKKGKKFEEDEDEDEEKEDEDDEEEEKPSKKASKKDKKASKKSKKDEDDEDEDEDD